LTGKLVEVLDRTGLVALRAALEAHDGVIVLRSPAGDAG